MYVAASVSVCVLGSDGNFDKGGRRLGEEKKARLAQPSDGCESRVNDAADWQYRYILFSWWLRKKMGNICTLVNSGTPHSKSRVNKSTKNSENSLFCEQLYITSLNEI